MGNTKLETAISEALRKDETLSRSGLYAKLSEALKITVDEVKTLLNEAKFSDEQKKVVTETLGCTVEALHDECEIGFHKNAAGECVADAATEMEHPGGCPSGSHMVDGKCVPMASETKKLSEALDSTFGTSNETTKKLSELKKLIETNSKDPETKDFMNDVVRTLIEMIPMVASMNPKFDAVETLAREVKSLKEQLDKSTLALPKLERAITEAKALTTKADKVLTEQNRGTGKGLHSTTNEDTPKVSSDKSFEELSLNEMIIRK